MSIRIPSLSTTTNNALPIKQSSKPSFKREFSGERFQLNSPLHNKPTAATKEEISFIAQQQPNAVKNELKHRGSINHKRKHTASSGSVVPMPQTLTTMDPSVVHPSEPMNLEILVIGNSGSGANSLAARFVGSKLQRGAGTCVVRLGEKSYAPVSVNVFHSTFKVDEDALSRACGAILVLDPDLPLKEATVKAKVWEARLAESRKKLGKEEMECVLVVSKQDQLAFKPVVYSQEELREWQAQEGGFVTSALTGFQVEDCFHALLAQHCPFASPGSLPSQLRSSKRQSKCIIS